MDYSSRHRETQVSKQLLLVVFMRLGTGYFQ